MPAPPSTPASAHPDWLAVGATVTAVRRIGRSVAWRKTATVVRHTKTSVVVDFGRGSTSRFVNRSGSYYETPQYRDYNTKLERPEAEA